MSPFSGSERQLRRILERRQVRLRPAPRRRLDERLPVSTLRRVFRRCDRAHQREHRDQAEVLRDGVRRIGRRTPPARLRPASVRSRSTTTDSVALMPHSFKQSREPRHRRRLLEVFGRVEHARAACPSSWTRYSSRIGTSCSSRSVRGPATTIIVASAGISLVCASTSLSNW